MARQKPERVTLAAVAKMAGVAESTASRVLNGYTHNFRVRPEVRARVIEAARELNYRPNPMVRSISAKKTHLVAVVGWASDGVNRTALAEAVRTCRAAGRHVCTTFLQPDNRGHELPSWRVDGALALQVRVEADLSELEKEGVPYVSINGPHGPGGDSVTFHEAHGMELALEHLWDLGHRKIGYLYLEQERFNPRGIPHGSVDARRRAYAEGLVARGAQPLDGWDRFELSFAEYLRSFVVGGRATALIVYDDMMALYSIQAAARLGLRVPDDLSIVTFNNEMPARMATPALTTVALPAADAGARAASLLLERIDLEPNAELRPRACVLEPSLVTRESTRPHPPA